MNRYQGNSFLVSIILRLSLLSVYSQYVIDASSAFVVVYPPPAVFCRFLQPVSPKRELQTARRRRKPHITTDNNVMSKSMKSSLFLHSSSSSSSSSSSPPPSLSKPMPSTSKHQQREVELWLDLRGTKVAPHVALMHIIQELREDSSSIDEEDGINGGASASIDDDAAADDAAAAADYDIFADRVLVSMDDGTGSNTSGMTDKDRQRQQRKHEVSKALMEGMIDEMGDARGNPIEIVYTLEDRYENVGKLYCHRSFSEKEEDEGIVPIGEVMNILTTGASSSNPLRALDLVSRGEWVFLDDRASSFKMTKSSSQDERSEAVQSLVELVSSGACASLSLFNLGDGNDGDGAKDDQIVHTGNGSVSLGGIAIGCRTNADILQIGSCVRSIVSVGGEGGYTATDSGIYIQASSDDKEEDNINTRGDIITPSSSIIIPSMLSEDTKKDSVIRYAVVIPFDTGLWKTAALLFR